MVKKQLDKAGIESYLLDRMKTTSQMYLEGKTHLLSKFSSSIVEVINEELPRKCPSVDGFKFIVHATVQVGVYIKNCQSQIYHSGKFRSGEFFGWEMSVGSRHR